MRSGLRPGYGPRIEETPVLPDDERGLAADAATVEAALRALLDEDDPLHPDRYDLRKGLAWRQAALWAIEAALASRRPLDASESASARWSPLRDAPP